MGRLKLPPTAEQIEAACRSWFSRYVTKWDSMGHMEKAVYRVDMRNALEAADEAATTEDSDNG